MQLKPFKFALPLFLGMLFAALFLTYGCEILLPVTPTPTPTPTVTPGECEIKPGDLKPGDDLLLNMGDREYYVYAPQNYNPCAPTSLIIDAHGAIESAKEHAGLDDTFCAPGMLGRPEMCWPGKGSGWRLEADMPGGGFIVVTPQGINNVWNQRPPNNDPDFMMNIVEHVQTIANIDPDKIYITGISNGAALTYWTGCPNSDVFAGLSPVAGGAACRSIPEPISVITFDAEPDFAYAGSVSASDAMVGLNNCNSEPEIWLTIDSNYDEPVCRHEENSTDPQLVPCSSVNPPIEPTVCKRWTGCDDGVEVVFCEVSPGTSHGPANAPSDAHILYQNRSQLNLPSLAWRFFKSLQD